MRGLLTHQYDLEQIMNNRVILAPRYNLRVEDFGDNHILALDCMSCGFKGAISAETLRQNYKPYERIKLVEGDFKCDGCGRHGVCQWHVEEIDAETKE
jgi:hypothetical protein